MMIGFAPNASQAIGRYVFLLPPGWSLCGWLGLVVLVMPVLYPIIRLIDIIRMDKDHCYKAMLSSIERGAGND